MALDSSWPPPAQPPSGAALPPRGPSTASGPEFGAAVKMFHPEKGFGFVALEGGTGDAFLHISVLQRAGADVVAPGARLRVRVGQGERGPQVTEVLEIVAAGDAPPPHRAGGPMFRPASQFGGGEEVQGTVKWYNAEKGFGFVASNSGGKDVFVHATALERSGTATLSEGQAVTMQVSQGKKGLEASTIRPK